MDALQQEIRLLRERLEEVVKLVGIPAYNQAWQAVLICFGNEALNLGGEFPEAVRDLAASINTNASHSEREIFMHLALAAHADLIISEAPSPSLHDVFGFAYAVGGAVALAAYLDQTQQRPKKGAAARSDAYQQKFNQVLEIYRTELQAGKLSLKMSGDKVAEELVGRVEGVSCRKIAELVRAEKKLLAKQNAEAA